MVSLGRSAGSQRRRGGVDGDGSGTIVHLSATSGGRNRVDSKKEKTKGKQCRSLAVQIVLRAAAASFVLVLLMAVAVKSTRSTSGLQSRRHRPKAEMGTMVYGTAWKGDQTASLVAEAVRAGFRHIATAAKHQKYNETGTGEGCARAASEQSLAREDLFIQTMYVPMGSPEFMQTNGLNDGDSSGAAASGVEDAVRASVQSSLANLQTTYLDAVLYHNVKNKLDSIDSVLETWRILEMYVDDGTIRHLGITNCHDIKFLATLYEKARIKPTIVQNRFHKNRQFGVPIRPFLRAHRIAEQNFWTLTGNRGTIRGEVAELLSTRRELTKEQFMYAFVLSLGGSPMVGTKSRPHMDQDIDVARKFDADGAGAFSLDAPSGGANADMQSFAKALGTPDLVGAGAAT